MKNQQGFTLIELVVVIVILGILAAVAVPKFIDMQVDARIASVDGLYGAVQSATSLARAQALVKGQTGVAGTIEMENETVALVHGYPAAAAVGGNDGIEAAVNLQGFSYNSTTGTFTLDGGPATCNVIYLEATSTSVPVITNNASTANCN